MTRNRRLTHPEHCHLGAGWIPLPLDIIFGGAPRFSRFIQLPMEIFTAAGASSAAAPSRRTEAKPWFFGL